MPQLYSLILQEVEIKQIADRFRCVYNDPTNYREPCRANVYSSPPYLLVLGNRRWIGSGR